MTSQPVACTLTSKDLATQRERWLQLAQHAFLDRVETENGLRLSFRADSSVGDELAQLVDVERECCAWADWLIEQGSGRITVVVSSTGEGVSALHGMFIAAGRSS